MEDTRIALGRRIRGLRRQQEMTQEELAEKAGLSLKYIGEVERGRGNPTLSTIEALADALRVEMADPIEMDTSFLTNSELRQQIDLMMDDASEEQLRIVYHFLDAVIR